MKMNMKYEHQKKVLKEKLLKEPRKKWNQWISATAESIKIIDPGALETEVLEELRNFASIVNREKALVVRFSDVRSEPIRWLWPGRIALGKLTLIAGDPGL